MVLSGRKLMGELDKSRYQHHRRKMQERQLSGVVNYFVAANAVVALTIILFGIVEHFSPTDTPRIITEKVIIAAIGGATLQAGAIIATAFKGLFSN
jgi:hypothetical protein